VQASAPKYIMAWLGFFNRNGELRGASLSLSFSSSSPFSLAKPSPSLLFDNGGRVDGVAYSLSEGSGSGGGERWGEAGAQVSQKQLINEIGAGLWLLRAGGSGGAIMPRELQRPEEALLHGIPTCRFSPGAYAVVSARPRML
jgi:hypothetical protein